jgi:hypothetical protein
MICANTLPEEPRKALKLLGERPSYARPSSAQNLRSPLRSTDCCNASVKRSTTSRLKGGFPCCMCQPAGFPTHQNAVTCRLVGPVGFEPTTYGLRGSPARLRSRGVGPVVVVVHPLYGTPWGRSPCVSVCVSGQVPPGWPPQGGRPALSPELQATTSPGKDHAHDTPRSLAERRPSAHVNGKRNVTPWRQLKVDPLHG